jgi:hypothetical protein
MPGKLHLSLYSPNQNHNLDSLYFKITTQSLCILAYLTRFCNTNDESQMLILTYVYNCDQNFYS